MYKTYLKFGVAAASLFLGLNLTDAKPAQAISNPFNFDVNVNSGSLDGNTYSGSFSYDDAGLTGSGSESVTVDNLDFTFEGTNYTEADASAPGVAEVLFEDGEFLGLSYSTNAQFSFFPGTFDSSDASFTYDVAGLPLDGGGPVTYTAVPFGVDSTKGILLLGGLFMAKKAIKRRKAATK